MLKRQVKTKSHRASVCKVALAFGLLFDDQAAGRAKSVYLAVVTDDAAFGGEQRAAYGNDFGFGAVSLVRLQGAYHFDIQIDGAKIDACFQHGVYCTAGDGVYHGGVKSAMHTA